ncbi:PadR family transcriptional regulator [Clostridium oryzae]|uniref:Transcriptional regulator PadR-like family protein n=1 Tax=Clostridium oryzae TaxID=1450648 RepID=A0A1V4INE0_9CLOT|nr:PadR family transcriptional regulator [Clostridium oryzae]OPJ61285.1 transcriptional regulator PadR-like family protein [Clostridium oryzae]
MDKSNLHRDGIKEEERKLYLEYKKKLKELRKVKKENESVGQVFTKGLLPLYVLFILNLGPSNGNDIANKVGKRTDGLWLPSTGGIYPILKRFEKAGLVEGKWDDPEKKLQKIYSLTELGIEEYEHKKKLLKCKIEESLSVFKIVYNDLYKKG